MNFEFKTIAQFNDYFKDEKTCYEYLENMVWGGNTPVCPHCATAKKPYTVKARGKFTDIPSYRCSERACGLPFTVRTGSIFEGSKVELRKWLQAAYELSISKKGISSVELATRIGVSQKTAWFINHRLRTMLAETNPALLSGIVEADETFVGGKESNKHASKKEKRGKSASRISKTGVSGKTMVLGLLQRDGKVRTFVVADRKAPTLQGIMRANVETNSRLITDSLNSYVTLKDEYNHESVKHVLGDYRTYGDKHTNNIEGYWSILKRGIIGTFHSVSPQHLQAYCDEFALRYNTRTQTTAERFFDTLKNAKGNRLTYKVLTAKKATN